MRHHHAPPVVYPIGRSRVQGLALSLVWLAGLATLLVWRLPGESMGWRDGLAVAVLAASGIAALGGWLRLPIGQLVWDGAAWRWEGPGYRAGISGPTVAVVADFQRFLVLRLQAPSATAFWLLGARSSMPERWHDLRRAVFAQPSAGLAVAVSLDRPADMDPLQGRT